MSDTYARLAERFPASAHKTRKQGGRDLTYVTGEMVIARLNEVLGIDGWSFEVKAVTVLENEVWAQGRLTVYAGERTVVREQTGGQIINRNRQGEIIEVANDIKGAVTDTLKKCATLVGVGAYLYDEDERREVEREMRGGNRPQPAPSKPDAKVEAAAQITGADPIPLKTKVELVADLQKGIEYARSLGLDPAEVDAARLNRAELEDVIAALRQQCRAAKKARAAG